MEKKFLKKNCTHIKAVTFEQQFCNIQQVQ